MGPSGSSLVFQAILSGTQQLCLCIIYITDILLIQSTQCNSFRIFIGSRCPRHHWILKNNRHSSEEPTFTQPLSGFQPIRQVFWTCLQTRITHTDFTFCIMLSVCLWVVLWTGTLSFTTYLHLKRISLFPCPLTFCWTFGLSRLWGH